MQMQAASAASVFDQTGHRDTRVVSRPGKHSIKKLLLRASCKCSIHMQPVCKNAVYRTGCQQSVLHRWHSKQARDMHKTGATAKTRASDMWSTMVAVYVQELERLTCRALQPPPSTKLPW